MNVTIIDYGVGNLRSLQRGLERDVENLLGYFERKYPRETPDLDRRALVDALAADEFEGVDELA